MGAKSEGRNVAQEAVRAAATQEWWDEWVASTMAMATAGTKPEYAFCPKCGVKVRLDRVDLMARVNAAKELQAMGFGKPKDDSESSRGFTLNRVVVVPESLGEVV